MSEDQKMSHDQKMSNENNPFDVVMEKIGTNGLFQKRYYWIFNFVFVIVMSWSCFNIILILAVPDHWCHVPGRENTNFTLEEWKNFTLPMDIDTRGLDSPSKCKMYNATFDSILNSVENLNQKFDVVDCQYGWDYDRTWYTETTASQENWVCEKELYVTNAFAIGRIGDVVGTFIFGQLGDLIGRKPVFHITIIGLIIGRCLTAFSAHSFNLFLFAILLGSLTTSGVGQSPLIISMEISSDSNRAHIAMLQAMGWTTGMSILPFIFWGLPHWMHFMLATSLPCVIFIFVAYKMLIESPRWLASQGKTAKCIRQLEVIAKVNKTTVPDDAMITLKKKEENKEKSYGVISLFSNWRLAKNTILLVTCWVNCALSFFVIILNVNALGGNPFLNFFAQAIAELPANFLGRIASDRIGRRLTQAFIFALSGVACIPLAIYINDPEMGLVVSGLAAFIKFCNAFVFYATCLQTLEIYPTCVRQTGLSFGLISAHGFGILGPYIVYLGTAYDARYPYYILTGLMFLGSVCAAFLPETLHQKLPETLADAHVFGADQKFFCFPKNPPKSEKEPKETETSSP